MRQTKILIVEDEPVIAQSIKRSLTTAGYLVVGTAYNSSKAMDMLASRGPDVALLDITIKGDRDGIAIAELINEKYEIPFLYLTAHSDDMTLDRAKHTFPSGYLVKPFKDKDLLAGIEMAIFRHENTLANSVPSKARVDAKLHTPTTEKEYQLLCDLARGLTNQQIAEHHDNTINTVKHHLKNLFLKMDVPNRSSAIRLFLGIS